MFQNVLRNSLVQGGKWYKRNHFGCNKEEPGSDKLCKMGKSLHCSGSQFSYLLNIEILLDDLFDQKSSMEKLIEMVKNYLFETGLNCF